MEYVCLACGILEQKMEATTVYCGYIGIMEETMETPIRSNKRLTEKSKVLFASDSRFRRKCRFF